MSKNINLLHSKRTRSPEQNTRILWIVAAASLFIIVISSIAVFSLKLQSQLPYLQKNENDLLSRLSVFQTKIIKYVLFTDRLNNISNIVSNRFQFDTKIDGLIKIIPPDININNISMDKKRISMTISTSSLFAVEIFINNIKTMVDNKQLFSRANFGGITVNHKKGEYSFSIEADLL